MWMFGKPVIYGLSETNRRKSDRIQKRLDGLVFGCHSRVGQSVFFGKFSEFLASAVEVAPLRQVTAVGKRHVKDRIGINVFEAVVPELDLVVAQNRVSVNSVVRRRANVMRESAQSQVRGLHSAANGRPAFEHQAPIPCFRQVSSRNQTVVPGTRHHDIEIALPSHLRSA